MTDKNPSGDAFNVPPPPGPPPGHNGLNMHSTSQYVSESHDELYDNPPPPAPAAAAASAQQQQSQQTTPHQPPPPDSDGAPKKASWGERFSVFGTKAAAPFNMLANKLGAETFLPSTMDKEVEKAARILRAFCSTCPLNVHGGDDDALVNQNLPFANRIAPHAQRMASTPTTQHPRRCKPRPRTPTESPRPWPPSPGRTVPS